MKLLNRDVIKLVAIIAMALNHIAHFFLLPGTPIYEFFNDAGYFTAVTMCYFLVEGYSFTRSKKEYGKRLLMFALISQIPFMLAFGIYTLNMIFTLFFCFLILYVLEKEDNDEKRVILVVLLFFATAFCDWGLLAPGFVLLFVWAGKDKKKKALAYGGAFLLYEISQYGFYREQYPAIQALARDILSGIGILVSGILIHWCYNGKQWERGKGFCRWFFYIFYPAHLLVLLGIKQFF